MTGYWEWLEKRRYARQGRDVYKNSCSSAGREIRSDDCDHNGRVDQILEKLRMGKEVGSLLYPDLKPQAARKRWLASHKQIRGTLIVDAGAANALKTKGRSLLPVGVTDSRGEVSIVAISSRSRLQMVNVSRRV